MIKSVITDINIKNHNTKWKKHLLIYKFFLEPLLKFNTTVECRCTIKKVNFGTSYISIKCVNILKGT